MRGFGDLLGEYMTRVGISDSELARTLGVRRQTIFRWKEGLVEKPRYRDDVLRCAEKLRLTPEERDALLLAAGFSPEEEGARPIVSPPTVFDSVEPSALPALPEAPALPEVRTPQLPTPRRLPLPLAGSWILAVVLLVALAAVGGLFLVSRPNDTGSYPKAADGETLVVVGSFAMPAEAVAVGRPTGPGTNERLRTALEREARAARLDRVRVAQWPVPIPENEAAAVLQRAGATVVVAGTVSPDGTLACSIVASSSQPFRAAALDALVVPPAELALAIPVTSPGDVQTLALAVLGLLHSQRGEYDLARAAFVQALAYPPADEASLAALYSLLGYSYQMAEPPDLNDALAAYGEALGARQTSSAFLNRGLANLRLGRTQAWQADFARALALSPNDGRVKEALCWAHTLDGKPGEALPYCDEAVGRGSVGFAREARGLAYARLGRLADAARELRAFTDWLAGQPEAVRARNEAAAGEWLRALDEGKNPIDEAVLARLRQG